MPGGAAQLKQAMRDVEAAVVRLRRATDEVSSGQPGQPGESDEPGALAEAERRLADLRAAHRALQEASTRLGTATSAALSDEGRRVVRLRRARDAAKPSRAAGINRTAEAGGTAVTGGAALADTGAPPAQRSGSRLLLAPSVIAVGIVGTLLVSLAVNAGIDPFRGQRLTPPPAAADGTGTGAPAIALPPVQAAAQPRVRAPAGEARGRSTESERRRAAKRATSRSARAPGLDR